MKYDRYDLVSAFEGPVSQDILHEFLRGYRNIELSPPWQMRIALVAKARYPIHVVDGDVNDTQRFLGAYKYVGEIDEQQLRALRQDSTAVVEYSGEFSCVTAPAGVSYPFVRHLGGTSKDYMLGGAFILLREGEQTGDFSFSWEGNGTGIVNIGNDLLRVTANSPEQQALLMDQIRKKYPGIPVAEETNEVGALEIVLRMDDNELLRLSGGTLLPRDLKSYRKFVRGKIEKLRKTQHE